MGAKTPIPLELTGFVGRRAEVSEAKRLLNGSRLVTVTGIGGVGKTRLGLRVAASGQHAFNDGAWLVELDEIRDGTLLPEVIATAVGLRPQGQSALAMLVDYFAKRELLLLLDNCEQIVEATASVVDTLLRACPRIHILVTSREVLGIGGEAVLRLPPLPVPDANQLPSLREAARCDAVVLFVERAAAVVPGFALTKDNLATIIGICRELEGLPLAIELAAARMRAMSPQQIQQRLSDRFALLTRGNRNAPNRQQTLQWSIDWSYWLCTPTERDIWAQLSVFAGSFDLEAAEEICLDVSEPEILLDVLTALVDKSILVREESDGSVRFRLLETVREYGHDKLVTAGRYVELRCRHTDRYLKLAQCAESDWMSPRQLEWDNRLKREEKHVREALSFCLSENGADPDAAVACAAAMQLVWFSRGQVAESRRWLERALTDRRPTDATIRAKALWRASLVAGAQIDPAATEDFATQASELAARSDDPIVHAFTCLARTIDAVGRGVPSHAQAPLQTALRTFSSHGDIYGQVWALLGLGWVHALRDDSAAAVSSHEAALAMVEGHGDFAHRAYALWATAYAVWRQGNCGRAVQLLQQAVNLTARRNDPYMAALAIEMLAWIAGSDGKDMHRSAVLLGAATALSRSAGTTAIPIPDLVVHHIDCETAGRQELGSEAFSAAFNQGMTLDLDSATDYAAGKLPVRARFRSAHSVKLTARESEVADLVADGLTNRAIAERLTISVRTAQGHVEHILTKLGFTSRTQIATWVIERGRPAPG